MQLYANVLKFDDEGYHLAIGAPGWGKALSPRANFDNFVWSFVAIFQVEMMTACLIGQEEKRLH